MRIYLRTYDLWQVVEVGGEVNPLPDNPTMGQIKNHREEVAKNFKALSCIQSALSEVIFARVMVSETTKEAWDKLKEEFHGSEKIRILQQVDEGCKPNQTYGRRDYRFRIMKKVLESLTERFEEKIYSLEDLKDLTKLSPSELIHALQAQEQRRSLRLEEATETALQAKLKGKMFCRVKKENNQQTQKANVSEVEEQEEFVFTVMASTISNDGNTWFLDIGSVKLADKTTLDIVGKGTVAIEAPKGTKFIQDVLLVPDLDQNLLSVGQMLEKDYMLLFKDKKCVVSDSSSQEVIVTTKQNDDNFIFYCGKIENCCATMNVEIEQITSQENPQKLQNNNEAITKDNPHTVAVTTSGSLDYGNNNNSNSDLTFHED
ncbi:uncharacterized protein LOC107841128 [Capsicum annuum]|uniref:uncharacterized protein LOC107841128 n=1 Tax=Capsicum annuum TaxID=4072 RepID=UPI001FB158B0|nr:uncharacterized protein LOC107841128 [Capsicum annuum]